MNVALFHDEIGPDASPDESDVLVQMDAIARAVRELGHTWVRVPCTLNLEKAEAGLRAARPDVVFNLVESIGGQGRLVSLATQLLDVIGVPYTGCPSAGTFLTACKPLAKQALGAAGIRTPGWHTPEGLGRGELVDGGRYILKSSWEHASRGIDDGSIVTVGGASELSVALQRRLPALAGEGFAERFIDGREFNVSVLCGEALPVAEIRFDSLAAGKARIVGYSAKWDEGSDEYVQTPRSFECAPSDRGLHAELRRISLECWRLFGLRGYARVDFRVDETGIPWVLEVNSNPCLSPDAGFAAAVERAGLTYTAAIERIISDAMA